MPSSSPSTPCGSDPITWNLRYEISPQSRSGGADYLDIPLTEVFLANLATFEAVPR